MSLVTYKAVFMPLPSYSVGEVFSGCPSAAFVH